MWMHRGLVFLKRKDGRHHVLDPNNGATSVFPGRPSQAYMYIVVRAATVGDYKGLTINATDFLVDQVYMVHTLGDKNNGWTERGSPPSMVGLHLGREVSVVRGSPTSCWHQAS
jgi:hypothetical protein